MPTEPVVVPEWGMVVLIRGLSVKQKGMFDKTFVKGRGRQQQIVIDDMKAKLVVRCIVDEQGNRVYQDDEYEIFNDQPATALDRLYTVAARLSSHTVEDQEELETLAKNFSSDQNDTSS